jgi:hypothetical protein
MPDMSIDREAGAIAESKSPAEVANRRNSLTCSGELPPKTLRNASSEKL